MKTTLSMLFLACGLLFMTACEPETNVVDPQLNQSSARKGVQDNFKAHLTGDEEVGPVETTAQGQATLKFSKDGLSVSYKINVAQLENVVGAHLHLAPAGANGPVVVGLLPAPVNGKVNGTLVEGTFTAAKLGGPLGGMTLEDLRTAMMEGNIYVNVHTTAHPGGQIRGQVD